MNILAFDTCLDKTYITLSEDKKIDKITVLSVAPLFAEAIMKIEEHRSLGDLFLYEK